jgi:hypothetical protein
VSYAPMCFKEKIQIEHVVFYLLLDLFGAEHLNICSTNSLNISKGAAHRNMFITVRCTFGTRQFRILQILGSSAAFINLTTLFFTRY